MRFAITFLLVAASAAFTTADEPAKKAFIEINPFLQKDEETPEKRAARIEVEKDTAAIDASCARVAAVFEAETWPELKFKVLEPAPKADLPKGVPANFRYKVSYEVVPDEDAGDAAKKVIAVIEIDRERLRNIQQMAYDLSHVVMNQPDSKIPDDLAIREPLAVLSTSGGEPLIAFGKIINDNGGPLSKKEFFAHYAEKHAAPKTEKEAKAFKAQWLKAHANSFVVGYDLKKRGVLKKFLAGEITAEELKKEIDPEAAWKRRKADLLPKPKPRRAFRGEVQVA